MSRRLLAVLITGAIAAAGSLAQGVSMLNPSASPSALISLMK